MSQADWDPLVKQWFPHLTDTRLRQVAWSAAEADRAEPERSEAHRASHPHLAQPDYVTALLDGDRAMLLGEVVLVCAGSRAASAAIDATRESAVPCYRHQQMPSGSDGDG
jgi:hypothetical protein